MILTLTANPSLDRTATLATPLERGAVHRLTGVTMQAAGKGVNIARAAVAAGVPTRAVLPAREDDPYVLELRAAGVPVRAVRPAGAVRINLSITEPDGTTTKLNSPGDVVTADDLGRLRDALMAEASSCTGADWVVLAGSVPPGTPPDWYADLVAALRTTAARIAVDTSDAPLRALVAGLPTSAPDLLKPNGDELASLTGVDGAALERDPVAVATAARDLLDRGVGAVLATLGGHGAVLVTGEGAWHATGDPVEVVSTVGAGDSSLFGYLLGDVRGDGPSARLARATAYGRAAVGLPGTTVPDPEQVEPAGVTVRSLAVTPA